MKEDLARPHSSHFRLQGRKPRLEHNGTDHEVKSALWFFTPGKDNSKSGPGRSAGG
jgi:hypothetical protein